MPFIDTKHDQQRKLEGMVRLFEDTLFRVASSSVPTVDFEKVLVVDMRQNHFDAFILSLRSDGSLHREARPIRIEEAETVNPARDRTPMCAYRKVGTSRWTVCSMARLRELSTDNRYEVVENSLEYITRLPEADRKKTFERLLFSFLSLVSETDSGTEYKRILFVVDDAQHEVLLQSVQPSLASKLDKDSGSKWRDAMIMVVDAEIDLKPYAFFRDPSQVDRTGAAFLVLTNPTEGHAYHYDGLAVHEIRVKEQIAFDSYDHVIVVGMRAATNLPSQVQIVADAASFEQMCLNGYILWWLQVDTVRTDVLLSRQQMLLEQLEQVNQRNSDLERLANRMEITLAYLKGHRG